MSRRVTLILALSCLIFTGLACSLAGPENAPAAVQPSLTSAPAMPATTQSPTATSTKVQIEIPTVMSTVAGEVLPTDTATSTPTPTPTVPTPTNTSTPRPPTATSTKKPVSSGPLTISYEVVVIKRNPGDQAVLTLKVIATGGAGGYTYYNDDLKQTGATFDVLGGCGKPFVHTLKVTSADGQTATLPYFIAGKCPVPTPTPKP
jgi:hypothetical protein